MTWINYKIFTREWLKRAERGKESVDDGDRFISLWIAFNGWMKWKYGENKTDKALVNKVKKLTEMEHVFCDMQSQNRCFSKDLKKLREYDVADMRYINDVDRTRRYEGTLESLIETIYQIRCNLFHGRKDTEENKKDFKLVRLSYRILLPLFKEYLKRYHYS